MLKHQERPTASQLSFVTTLLNSWYCCGAANGEILINALKYHPFLCHCFEQPIQDFEDQTLEMHTLKVIRNFLTRICGKQSFFERDKGFCCYSPYMILVNRLRSQQATETCKA